MQKLGTATQNLKPERRHLTADLIAGLTFAVVNVPQAMAHALLATVNPVYGIYTLMVAVPIGAIFTSSVFMNVSTTGALSAGSPISSSLAESCNQYRMNRLLWMRYRRHRRFGSMTSR